jgi:hypothetical protein
MAHTFKYAVLMAIPDARRGERVNVGLIVFLNDHIDVRFSELSKIRALAGGYWDDYATDVKRRLIERFASSKEAEAVISRSPELDPVFHASDLSWLSIDAPEEYENRIKEILAALVNKPKAPTKPQSRRINTEIARQLSQYKILARPDDPIDSHKVHRDFVVSREEDLVADFALKNGAMHITATLDFRRAHVRLDEAALKAIVLNKAASVFADGVRLLGVYAATPDMSQQFKPHLELLKDYAHDTYNWLDAEQRSTFTTGIQRAAALPFRWGNGV